MQWHILKAEAFATNIKLQDANKNANKSLPNDSFLESWNSLVKRVLDYRKHLQKYFFKTIQEAAAIFETVQRVSRSKTLGNNHNNLLQTQRNLLTKTLVRCNKGQQECKSNEQQENGTFLIHRDANVQVEVIITFVGTSQSGTTTINKYEVLTLTIYFC